MSQFPFLYLFGGKNGLPYIIEMKCAVNAVSRSLQQLRPY